MRRKISSSSRTWSAKIVSPAGWQADVDLIFGPFTAFLRRQGYADGIVRFYQRVTVRAARHLASHGQRITELSRCGLPDILRSVLGDHASNRNRNNCRAALRRWLKFNGTFYEKPQAGWIDWVDAFDHFAVAHRGLAGSTRTLCRYFLYDYLNWQFGRRAADWADVRAQDIWSYVSERSRRVKISTVSRGCSVLRAFFRFLHLRGDCSQLLISSVPTIANRGADYHPGVLSEAQCKRLLTASRRHPLEGTRNYAMLLCLCELGLRRVEVVNLRVCNLDLSRGLITIASIKGGRERQLPLSDRLAAALHVYLTRDRPAGASDALFLRRRRRCGQPITGSLLGDLVKRLYRQCGFPAAWCGTHRLRHTFATRLFQHGTSLKLIADHLGHRRLQTSRRYTHLDLDGLRSLARPWPQ